MLHLHYTNLDSTNAAAKRLAAMNPGQMLLVSARTQTAGRGRLGRTWQSPAGGAWFSLATPAPENALVTQSAPLVVGAAVLETLQELLAAQTPNGTSAASPALSIKWPNDILLGNRKVCGILCERTLGAASADENRPSAALILGIGINANMSAVQLTDVRFPAVSLADVLGHPVELPRLIDACGRRIAAGMETLIANGLPCSVLKTIKRHLAWKGCRVRLAQGNREIDGIIMGIDALGRLMLRTYDGVEMCNAGEVTTVRPVAAPSEEPLAV